MKICMGWGLFALVYPASLSGLYIWWTSNTSLQTIMLLFLVSKSTLFSSKMHFFCLLLCLEYHELMKSADVYDPPLHWGKQIISSILMCWDVASCCCISVAFRLFLLQADKQVLWIQHPPPPQKKDFPTFKHFALTIFVLPCLFIPHLLQCFHH